jgi:hypothetical protein
MSHQEVETSLPVEKGKKETFLGGQRRAMKPVKEGEEQVKTCQRWQISFLGWD